jgi:hypothetical protein
MKKFHTLARLDQSVCLASSCGPVFDLATYMMQVCPTFIPTQYSTQSLSGRIWKKAKSQMPLVRYHIHWAIEWIIWGTYISLQKFIKPPDRWLIKEPMIGDSIITVLSCNHPSTWKRCMHHMYQGKGWTKCQLI